MAESKVKPENYIMISGWMVCDLGLKGNELLVYAIIYGFSQSENQMYNGSLQYLADWTNSTKQGVIKSLKSLTEKGYISKKEDYINGVKFCSYYATKFNGVLNKVEWGIKQSLPNNTIDNKEDNTRNKYTLKIHEIILYLNEKAGTNYRESTPKTVSLITKLLSCANPFSVDDFKKVIDNKCAEWKGTDWEKYLRPETLFGNKFESYLNQKGKQSEVNPYAGMDADSII